MANPEETAVKARTDSPRLHWVPRSNEGFKTGEALANYRLASLSNPDRIAGGTRLPRCLWPDAATGFATGTVRTGPIVASCWKIQIVTELT